MSTPEKSGFWEQEPDRSANVDVAQLLSDVGSGGNGLSGDLELQGMGLDADTMALLEQTNALIASTQHMTAPAAAGANGADDTAAVCKDVAATAAAAAAAVAAGSAAAAAVTLPVSRASVDSAADASGSTDLLGLGPSVIAASAQGGAAAAPAAPPIATATELPPPLPQFDSEPDSGSDTEFPESETPAPAPGAPASSTASRGFFAAMGGLFSVSSAAEPNAALEADSGAAAAAAAAAAGAAACDADAAALTADGSSNSDGHNSSIRDSSGMGSVGGAADVAAGALELDEALVATLDGHPDFRTLAGPHESTLWAAKKQAGGGVQGKSGGGAAGASAPGTAAQHCLCCEEAKLRPDMFGPAIQGAFVSVAMQHGMSLTERTRAFLRAEKGGEDGGSADDSEWVEARLGISRDKMRVMMLMCGAGSRRAGLAAKTEAQRLLVALKMALIEGGMTLSSLSMDAFQASFDNFGAGDDHAAAIADDELLDPDYVTDLEAMAVAEVKVNLVKFAAPLEVYVRERELKSAQIESLLNEAYIAHATPKPRMALPRPLADYPLQKLPPAASLPSSSSSEQPSPDADAAAVETAVLSRGERVAALAKEAWERVMTRCNAEAQARMARKNLQIIDRVTAIDKQRYALVAWLRDSDTAVASPKTAAFHATFATNAAAEGGLVAGVLLHSTPCVHRSRPGTFFVAFGHLAFHSSIIGFRVTRVVPLERVRACRKGAAALGLAPSIIFDVAGPPAEAQGAPGTAAGGGTGAGDLESVSFHFPVDRDQLYELIDQVLAMNRGSAQSHDPLAGVQMPPPLVAELPARQVAPRAPKTEIQLLDADLGEPQSSSLASVLTGGLSGLWGGRKSEPSSGADEDLFAAAVSEPGTKSTMAVADLLDAEQGCDSGEEDEL